MTNNTQHTTNDCRSKSRAKELWAKVVGRTSSVVSYRSPRPTAGFTVLFAMLIAAIILGVGLAIFDILFKELTFATVVRDSNYASYAADTGIECALFWEFKCDIGGACPLNQSSGFASSSSSRVPSSGMVCDGQDFLVNADDTNIVASNGYVPRLLSATAATTTFAMYMNTDDSGVHLPPYCAIIQIFKNTPVTTGITKTVIISRGYNTCDVNNLNRIERAYSVQY